MSEDGIELFDQPRAVILPSEFLEILEAAIKDPSFYMNTDEGSNRLTRSIAVFRERNNLTQSELMKCLNVGYHRGNPVTKLERGQLKDVANFKIITRALASYASANSGYVSWVDARDSQIRYHVDKVKESLLVLVECLSKDNENPNENIFNSELEKQQLVAILKAALAELEAPKLDKGRMSQVFSWTSKLAGRVAKKKAENALSSALDTALDDGTELLKKISELPGKDSLF